MYAVKFESGFLIEMLVYTLDHAKAKAEILAAERGDGGALKVLEIKNDKVHAEKISDEWVDKP